jgi:uncharacterized membrane protein YeiH
MGLLLAALGAMVRDVLAARSGRRDAFCAMATAGLLLTVVFSLVDIPFRCPAILYTWVALLSAMPLVGAPTPAGQSVPFRRPQFPSRG